MRRVSSSILALSIILEENWEEMWILVSFLKLPGDVVPGLRGDKEHSEAVALDLEVALLLPPTYWQFCASLQIKAGQRVDGWYLVCAPGFSFVSSTEIRRRVWAPVGKHGVVQASGKPGLEAKGRPSFFTGFMGDNPRVGWRNVTLNAGIDLNRNIFILQCEMPTMISTWRLPDYNICSLPAWVQAFHSGLQWVQTRVAVIFHFWWHSSGFWLYKSGFRKGIQLCDWLNK